MAIALERLCTSLQLPNGDLTEEIMAMNIVAVVKQGLRDPDEIFERIIDDLNVSAPGAHRS